MKKSFMLLFLAFISITSAYAQINKDKVEEDGSRVILSDSKNLYRKMASAAGFYLAYVLDAQGNEEWSLEVKLNEGKSQIAVGRKLLIKSDDGSVMELQNSKEIGPADYTYNVTRYGTDYYVRPSYILTEAQLKTLINSKVIKIRIETDSDMFDREIKSAKFQKNLKEMYDAICAQKQKSNNVYDGF